MKTYKILFLILLSLSQFSCKKGLLDPLPKDRLAGELFWKTAEDAIYASNGVYALLGNQWRYASMDAFSDIGHFVLQWRSESELEKNTFNASNNVIADQWSYHYSIIRAANDFLENVELVPEIDGTLKSRLIAEVKTLRAYSYVNLIMEFGDVPLVVTTITAEQAKTISRTSKEEIWDFISRELTAAAGDLPVVQQDLGRITKGAALGIQARGMLYAARYKEAKAAALAVMDLEHYQIDNSYASLFDYAGKNSKEVIFSRQYVKDLDAHSIFAFFTPNSLFALQCQVVPTKQLVDTYLVKSTGLPIDDPLSHFDPRNPYQDRDPRLHHTVFTNGDVLPNGKVLNSLPGSGTADDISSSAENVSPTGWYFKKYVSKSDFSNPWNSGLNLIYLRYAEVLLTYAEASVELNEIDQTVLDAVNQLRGRNDVDMPDVTVQNQTDLRKIIRRERLVELAVEGQRLYDVRRWEIGPQAIKGTVKGMTYINPKNPEALITVNLAGFVKEFDAQKHYLWPIPFRELNLNKELVQNKGY